MKARIRLLTSKDQYRKSKGFPVVLIVQHKDKRIKRVLAYSELKYWNLKREMPFPSHPDYDELYFYIYELKIKSDKISRFETDPKKVIELILESPKDPIDFKNFCQWGFDYCNSLEQESESLEKHGKIVERNRLLGNIRVYRTALKQFEIFGGDVPVSDINYSLLMTFRRFKLSTGVSKTSVFAYLRTLRALFNIVQSQRGLEERFPFKKVMNGLSVPSYASKKKFLEKEDINKLESVSYKNTKQQYLDLFLLQFYMGGADLIDVYFLKKNQLQKNRIFFERGKSGTLVIDLALNSRAQQIIARLRNPSGEYLFPWRKDKTGYENFRRRYQRVLVEIQKDLDIQVKPTGGNIGVKVARHTFATLAVFAGVESDLIREFMGHQRDDVDNYYKARFPQEFRDEQLFSIIGA